MNQHLLVTDDLIDTINCHK